MMKILAFLPAFFLCCTLGAQAQPYVVDYDQSQVTFSGVQAGQDFTGHFETWTALIDFKADDVAASHITARFQTASATTGNVMLDGALPKADWFNAESFPEALFTSRSIRPDGQGGYIMDGALEIRGVSQSVSIPFTLSDLLQSPVTAAASFTVDRTDFEIGLDSDPDGEWVDKMITVTIHLVATAETAE